MGFKLFKHRLPSNARDHESSTHDLDDARLIMELNKIDQQWSTFLTESHSTVGCNCQFCNTQLEGGSRRSRGPAHRSRGQRCSHYDSVEQNLIETLYPRQPRRPDSNSGPVIYRHHIPRGEMTTAPTYPTLPSSRSVDSTPVATGGLRRESRVAAPAYTARTPEVLDDGSIPPPAYSKFDPALRRFQFPESRR